MNWWTRCFLMHLPQRAWCVTFGRPFNAQMCQEYSHKMLAPSLAPSCRSFSIIRTLPELIRGHRGWHTVTKPPGASSAPSQGPRRRDRRGVRRGEKGDREMSRFTRRKGGGSGEERRRRGWDATEPCIEDSWRPGPSTSPCHYPDR